MQKINWTQAMDENIQALRDSGMSHDEIGFSMGISGDCVSGRIRRLKNKTTEAALIAPSKDVAKIDVLEMENARLKLELEKAKSTKTATQKASPVKESRVVVKAEWNEQATPMEDIWEKAERESADKIDKAKNQGRFSCEFPSDRVVALSFISDQHIAPGTPCDFKRMRLDAELVASTPDLYCVLNGDGVDNHIRHFAAVLNARSTPNDQWTLYEHYLQILADSILVITQGNHEGWTAQMAGVDMISRLARDGKFCYAPFEARMNITHGAVDYKVALRHQYRLNSSFNQGHAVKQWQRLGDEEFDIGCIGHHHEACIEMFMYRAKECWGCRPGAYQITSAYAAQYGYNDAVPTCPTFLLFPDKRKIIGLPNVHDVPAMLKTFNG